MPSYVRLSMLCLALILPAAAQQTMAIKEASARLQPSLAPAHEGKSVLLQGVVAGPTIRLRTYSHAILQDEQGNGITVEGSRDVLAQVAPGDKLEVAGVIGNRAGLPTLRLQRLKKLGSGPPVAPQQFGINDLVKFSNVGRYVAIESHVLTTGQNSGGDIVAIGDSDTSVLVFLPRERRTPEPGLRDLRPGDKIRITGFSSQYCPVPPYDRDFQILIGDAADISVLSRGWLISPGLLFYCLIGAAFAVIIWWRRERRMTQHRRVLQSVMSLSEDVISASSPREIVRRLQSELPRAIEADEVEVFLHSRTSHSLDRISSEAAPQPLSIAVEEPIGSFYSTVALCFRNRALLHVPDTRRSPILTGRDSRIPASAVFVPMLAQRELLGVLAAYYRKPSRRAHPDRHAALQHLSNQVAASLKLQEQQHMREQLLRSEKMAAAGQLISGVANDLRAPLESISRAARHLSERPANNHEFKEIAADAERGLEIVSHLVAFARMERSEARPLDLYAIVNNLLDIRQQDRERKGVKAENSLPVSPLQVLADQPQLEQALLTMLVHAEHAAGNSADHLMRISSRVVGKKAQVAIDCALTNAADPFSELAQGDYFGLPVAQAIAQSHGGDLRYLPGRHGFRLEFEMPVHLPAASTETAAPAAPSRPVRVLTALIVEPDTVSQRKLLAMLAVRGHRAIPAATAEEAADLVQRMAFDVVFCGVRLPGLNWVELFQRVRRRVGAFALVTEGYDAESARAFKGGEGQILPKPIEDRDLDSFLALIEVRQAASRR